MGVCACFLLRVCDALFGFTFHFSVKRQEVKTLCNFVHVRHNHANFKQDWFRLCQENAILFCATPVTLNKTNHSQVIKTGINRRVSREAVIQNNVRGIT